MKVLSLEQLSYYTSKLTTFFSDKFSLKDHTHTDYASKSISVNTNLLANDWVGETTPFSITISDQRITDTNNIDVISRATSHQEIEAWGNLGYMVGTQEVGSITIQSYGFKPTIDIPITLVIRGDS